MFETYATSGSQPIGDIMFNRRIAVRRARRLFQAAPVEWALALLLSAAIAATAWIDGPMPDLASTLMWGMALAIPPVAFCTALCRAGRINFVGRCIGTVGALLVGCAAGGQILNAIRDAELAFAYLSVSLVALALLPTISRPEAGGSSNGRGTWRRSMRLFLKLAYTIAVTGWISLLVAFVVGAFATSWGAVAGVAAFFVTFACTTTLGVVAVVAGTLSNYEAFDAPLSGAELLVSKTAFVLASLAAMLGGIALYTVRATTAGTDISVQVASMQGSLLIGLAIIGPMALFIGAPFVTFDRDIRAEHSFIIGMLMRLFPPAYVALFAWAAPTVVTRWAELGWTSAEKAGTITMASGFAYCVLRTAFDLLGLRLPNWVIPVVYTAGAVAFASVNI